MSFKLITILKEALDVSWNPFEERNIKQYDELLNGYIGDVLMMAKDRSIYSKGLKKSEIPSEVYEQLRFEHDNHEGEVSGLDAIMENFSEDEILERITKLLSQFNLKEALDVSWNPYQEPANYTNKVYNFVDCDTSSKGPIVSMFFQDENENDLKIEVDTKTRSIIRAQDWGENGDENILDAKTVKELNQNPYLKKDIDVISKFLFVHMEALDVSWNPYEDHDYTVMMGKLDKEGPNSAIIRHYAAKDEHGALTEFFIESLGQNPEYAEIAIKGTKEVKLKNSIGYGTKYDNFFWIVAKGNYDENYMANISKEYRQKHNI